MMFKALVRFFKGPTVEEAYENGKACTTSQLAAATDKKAEAAHLFALASGGFNTTPAHAAFDRGVCDRLYELGYEEE